MIYLQLAFLAAAAFIGYLGYQIRYKGRVDLIAGYDKSKKADNEAMGQKMGRSLFSVAAILLLSTVSLTFYEDHVFLVIGATVVLLVVVTVYSAMDSET